MKTFKHLAGGLALCAAFGVAGGAAAQDDRNTTVQDGIEVRPLSRFSKVVPAETVNQAAAQQYTQMMSQAQQKGVLLPPSHPEVQRLRAIARRIIPHSTRWNQEASRWQWQVNVIDSKDVNAFCMPGGRIGFFTGILTSLKLTDDEVAAVMGHEIAHALREHSREKMAKQGLTNIGARLTGLAASAFFGVDPNITGMVTNAGAQLVGLKFSRNDEREADLVGLDIAARAGYDPRAGIALWRKMAALSQRAPIELLSTHPGGESRINDMQAHMNVLLPVYARTKGTTAAKLPPYRSNVALR
ncbi:M48 family metallopeptidase [Massilia sp. MS-15]|uniref:M48 family metallopeptidase n=1 Tax=Massilia sp. MS-15 TaxID=2878200 RepID=UPI001CD7A5EF|nr:M48 family metallopeptidase [Massilia sp. MS-15]MCA1246879.1 M48 family metallopeptidase [Massilia sp. MS-15]